MNKCEVIDSSNLLRLPTLVVRHSFQESAAATIKSVNIYTIFIIFIFLENLTDKELIKIG